MFYQWWKGDITISYNFLRLASQSCLHSPTLEKPSVKNPQHRCRVENPPIPDEDLAKKMGLLLIRFSRIQPIRWPFDNAGTVNGKGFPWESGTLWKKISATSLWNESDIKISELTTSRMQRLFTFKVANPHWLTLSGPLRMNDVPKPPVGTCSAPAAWQGTGWPMAGPERPANLPNDGSGTDPMTPSTKKGHPSSTSHVGDPHLWAVLGALGDRWQVVRLILFVIVPMTSLAAGAIPKLSSRDLSFIFLNFRGLFIFVSGRAKDAI